MDVGVACGGTGAACFAAGTVRAGLPPSSELEIEKKFAIPDDLSASHVERKLSSLGFGISRREEFADWYFDTAAPRWHFTLRDCWFRYREKKVEVGDGWGWRGTWQVKRGRRKDRGDCRTGAGAMGNDGVTVYQELQGKDAEELILNLLSNLNDEDVEKDAATSETRAAAPSSPYGSVYGGFDVPFLAGAECLVPFARLETSRKSYETANDDSEFRTLKVDIDKTDFGYNVGEVEAVLGSDSDEKERVDATKEKILKLVNLISTGNEVDEVVAVGKLEYYLMNHHRDHYDACVQAGVMN